jgi:two-component system nitrate/nitrite response regulator NarL
MNPPPIETAPATPVVWIVEDNEILRRNLQRLCTPARELVCSATFGSAEAMLKALSVADGTVKPDVMLMDVGLPGRSGLEVLADVVALAPDCRVVILTVFEDEKKISDAISAGACGYLLKTAHPDDIVKAIHEAANGGSPMSPAVAASVVKLLASMMKPAVPVALTPREREMLALIVDGLTAKAMAERLDVSIHTIDTHVRHLFRKLGVQSRTAAAARAFRDRLL